MSERTQTIPGTVLGGDEWSNFLAAVKASDWARSVALAKGMLRAHVGDKEFEVDVAQEFQRQWGDDGIEQVKSICAEAEAEAEAAQRKAKAEADAKAAQPAPKVVRLSAFAKDRAERLKRMAAMARAEAEERAKAKATEPAPEPKQAPTRTAITEPPQSAAELLVEFAKPQPQPQTQSKSLALRSPQAPVVFQHSRTPAGIPQSLENAIIAIENLGIDCKYDIFHDRIVVKEHQIGLRGDALNNLDNVALKVRQAVLVRFQFDPGATFTFDALKIICLDRVFDPVLDYLDNLHWDGVPRLEPISKLRAGVDRL
jgi:hypothetical protein